MAMESIKEHPLVVDLDARTITIPEELKYIGVEADNNSEKVWFKVARYFDEPDVQGNGDLYQKTAQVHFVNADGSFGVYTINEVKENDDGTISLAWLIGRDVTIAAGEVKFQLVFVLFDNGDNVYKLSTSPAILMVRPGINSSDFSISKESLTYEQLIELIYDGYETLKAVDEETLRNLSASPKGIVTKLSFEEFEGLESGLYLYMPSDTEDEYYGFVVYWDGVTVSEPIVKYLTTTFGNGCIVTNHIVDNAITNEKLADNSVNTNNIINDSVTDEKLADNSVGNSNLKNNAITMEKLNNAYYEYSENGLSCKYGVVDAVNSLLYNVNGINKIGVLSNGTPIYRKNIYRHITENEKILGYVSDLLLDYHDDYRVTMLGVNLYMESEGVIVPLSYKFNCTKYWDGIAGEMIYPNEDIVYLNGIVSENDGIYKVKALETESWYLEGTIIFAAEPAVIMM